MPSIRILLRLARATALASLLVFVATATMTKSAAAGEGGGGASGTDPTAWCASNVTCKAFKTAVAKSCNKKTVCRKASVARVNLLFSRAKQAAGVARVDVKAATGFAPDTVFKAPSKKDGGKKGKK